MNLRSSYVRLPPENDHVPATQSNLDANCTKLHLSLGRVDFSVRRHFAGTPFGSTHVLVWTTVWERYHICRSRTSALVYTCVLCTHTQDASNPLVDYPFPCNVEQEGNIPQQSGGSREPLRLRQEKEEARHTKQRQLQRWWRRRRLGGGWNSRGCRLALPPAFRGDCVSWCWLGGSCQGE